MKIVFDYQTFTLQRHGGISRYFTELASRLSARNGLSVRVFAPLFKNQHLRDKVRLETFGIYLPHIPMTTQIRFHSNALLFSAADRLKPCDLVHRTYYLDHRNSSAKQVLTVFDCTQEKFHKRFHLKDSDIVERKQAAISAANHLICVSMSTRSDLIEYHSVDESKISVIYLGSSLPDISASEEARQINRMDLKNKPFLLYVGERETYKNFLALLEAYSRSRHLSDEFRLICFGGPPFSVEERKIIERCQMKDSVLHRGGDDIALTSLYRSASLFVYPSMSEGFGIPLLEAMSAGCPVACSKIGSFPEVAGSAAAYFDPERVESIQEVLESVLFSSSRGKELTAAGSFQAQKFSWERCAEETLSVYKTLVG